MSDNLSFYENGQRARTLSVIIWIVLIAPGVDPWDALTSDRLYREKRVYNIENIRCEN